MCPIRPLLPSVRIILALCISLLCAAVLLAALPMGGEEQIYDRVIRLHVLANSDSPEDQALKLRVRDAILVSLNELQVAADTAADAERAYTGYLPQLEEIARRTAADAGYDYPCRVTLTEEVYPIRTYENGRDCYTLPAGTYRSLRVMIGEAQGQNWWCVLFPPLCLSLAAAKQTPPADAIPVAVYEEDTDVIPTADEQLLASGFTPYEISLISGEGSPKTIVKFRIVEFFRRLLKNK